MEHKAISARVGEALPQARKLLIRVAPEQLAKLEPTGDPAITLPPFELPQLLTWNGTTWLPTWKRFAPANEIPSGSVKPVVPMGLFSIANKSPTSPPQPYRKFAVERPWNQTLV